MAIEIIAEIAQGFEGSPEQSRLLIKAAAAAGADAVKFQLVYADELATKDYKFYPLFASLEMTEAVWNGLAEFALELRIELQVDIFGVQSLALAEKLGLSTVKLHSTDITNFGLLNQVAKSSIKKVLLGAGGANLSELIRAAEILTDKKLIILLGFQGYPTPIDANHISRVSFLVDRIARVNPSITIGFADHALPESALQYALGAVAVGAGARVIEKHLTLGKVMKLEDHESALNPDEFLEFTKIIHSCFDAYGALEYCENFAMSESECEYRKAIRRHVVAIRDLQIGEVVSPFDLVLKRTSAEHPIEDLSFVYGKVIKRHVMKNDPISIADIG